MINSVDLEKYKQLSKSEPFRPQLHLIPGIWVNGKYFWLHSTTEKVIYEEELIIRMTKKQIHSKIAFHHIFVSNHSHQPKEIKIMAMHHFQSVNQDCLTFVSPIDQRIFHHAGHDVYLVNLFYDDSKLPEYTTILLRNVFSDQIWSSLKTGSLHYLPLAKGPSASIHAVKMTIQPQKVEKVSTWTISGKNKNEVIALEQALLKIH